jgi:hypothetical protein
MNTWLSLLLPHNKRVIVFHACFVTGSANVLNYLWENRQGPWFFIHRGWNTGQIAMVFVTLDDVALTWMAQGLVATVLRRWLWLLGPWHWRQWAVLLGAALALSVLVESWALATSQWAYTATNPRVPGTPDLDAADGATASLVSVNVRAVPPAPPLQPFVPVAKI